MDEAEQLCDRLVVMDGGRIVAEGSPGRADRPLLHPRGARAALPARRAAADATALDGLADRVEVLPDRLLLYAGDGEARARRRARRGAAAGVQPGAARHAGGRVPAADRTDAGGLMSAPWTLRHGARAARSAGAALRDRRRGHVDLVPAQLARHRRLQRRAAAAVPAGASGFGLGSQVRRRAAATGGLRYVVYLAPALLVVDRGADRRRSSRPTRSCPAFKWQQTYLAHRRRRRSRRRRSLAGQLIWIAIRLAGSGAVYLRGGRRARRAHRARACCSRSWSRCSPALAFAAPVAAYSAHARDRGQQFSVLFRFVVMPMTLFAGHVLPDRPAAGVAAAAGLAHRRSGTAPSSAATPRSARWTCWPALGHLALPARRCSRSASWFGRPQLPPEAGR